ncbi:hypothetical protein [uncultured phage cr116_1]|uniref:Homing endonuclease LAGLIDADG domain-containing protein n=1 Tax=uncultured phage cr116_1 TaxID=2772073 RepID=A0A7M1RY67_9CAUD|nr:hypothetical protein KNV40_gp050 [uncultured phage cr116_1]QOR59393.1 hypothetical protein [uncultured phage cr116_1]DAK53075.1 MAG TPA: endonuclease [Crassvirales sp.]
MKTKFNKESRNLLIGLLIGDGTISNNNVFKIAHCEAQKDYLEWKINQLKSCGIRNNGIKSYIKTKGFNIGVPVYYTQLNTVPFIKVLRRVFYKGKKIIGNRKLLNRLSAKEIAIWYMDDGHINIRKDKGRPCGFYIKISTCEPKQEVQTIIDYFKEQWNINFYMYHEGKKEDSYSLCCGTKEGLKFIDIIKPYVLQVPSMIHKITYDLTQRHRPL